VLFYHQDQIGSTRALTDSTGAVVQRYQYDSYDNLAQSSGSATNPFQFAGQYLDSESGLYCMRARYYEPSTGQFISRDPIVSQTRQPYSYAADSPTTSSTRQVCMDTNSIGTWVRRRVSAPRLRS
jgi:RHS repeat-associated protein